MTTEYVIIPTSDPILNQHPTVVKEFPFAVHGPWRYNTAINTFWWCKTAEEAEGLAEHLNTGGEPPDPEGAAWTDQERAAALESCSPSSAKKKGKK